MPLDVQAVQRACRGSEVTSARQLCRTELDKFRTAVAAGAPLTIGCTQEAPLFAETAEGVDIRMVNIRETAGWSGEAAQAGPKMAALLAVAAEPRLMSAMWNLKSDGVVLIYGCDERVLEAAELLKDHLDITVLIKPPRCDSAAARSRISVGARATSVRPRASSARSSCRCR